MRTSWSVSLGAEVAVVLVSKGICLASVATASWIFETSACAILRWIVILNSADDDVKRVKDELESKRGEGKLDRSKRPYNKEEPHF